jgi:hypothetical protein
MRKLHLTNAEGRDSTVAFYSLTSPPPPRMGLPGESVTIQRYLAATDGGLHEVLSEKFEQQPGEGYGQALVDGDPEVDQEWVGRRIGETSLVLLSARGEVLHAAPRDVELILGPDGVERERRPFQETPPNVTDEAPVRWSGRRLPRGEVVRRFAFARTLQVRHVDGLTYDFLHAMARELDEKDVMVHVGAGAKGREPLVFQQNGSRYQGFLEGRVDGPRYQLLLHLSNLELKRPA